MRKMRNFVRRTQFQRVLRPMLGFALFAAELLAGMTAEQWSRLITIAL